MTHLTTAVHLCGKALHDFWCTDWVWSE